MNLWKESRLGVIAAVCLGMLLTGCGSDDRPAIDATEADMVGTWTATYPASELELVLSADGTYRATRWPKNLVCSAAEARSAGAVSWQDTLLLEGTWSAGGSSIVLFASPEQCSGISPSGMVLVDPDGQLKIEFVLVTIDVAESDDFVTLTMSSEQ